MWEGKDFTLFPVPGLQMDIQIYTRIPFMLLDWPQLSLPRRRIWLIMSSRSSWFLAGWSTPLIEDFKIWQGLTMDIESTNSAHTVAEICKETWPPELITSVPSKANQNTMTSSKAANRWSVCPLRQEFCRKASKEAWQGARQAVSSTDPHAATTVAAVGKTHSSIWALSRAAVKCPHVQPRGLWDARLRAEPSQAQRSRQWLRPGHGHLGIWCGPLFLCSKAGCKKCQTCVWRRINSPEYRGFFSNPSAFQSWDTGAGEQISKKNNLRMGLKRGWQPTRTLRKCRRHRRSAHSFNPKVKKYFGPRLHS